MLKLLRIYRNRHHRVRGRFTDSSHEVLEEGPPKHGTRRCGGVKQSFSLFCVFSHTITIPLSVDALKSLVPRPLRCVDEVACERSDWSRFDELVAGQWALARGGSIPRDDQSYEDVKLRLSESRSGSAMRTQLQRMHRYGLAAYLCGVASELSSTYGEQAEAAAAAAVAAARKKPGRGCGLNRGNRETASPDFH